MQQQDQRGPQVHGIGVPGQAGAEPHPQAPQAGAVFAGQQQAAGPAQQQDPVEPQQATQGPEDIHGAGTQCSERQACAADDHQHG